jgi:hypothetical protein
VIRALHAMHLQTACDSEHVAQNAGRSSARSILTAQASSAALERVEDEISPATGSPEVSLGAFRA